MTLSAFLRLSEPSAEELYIFTTKIHFEQFEFGVYTIFGSNFTLLAYDNGNPLQYVTPVSAFVFGLQHLYFPNSQSFLENNFALFRIKSLEQSPRNV